MQESSKIFGLILDENTQEEWGHIIANTSNKKLEVIKYDYTGNEIPVIKVPFYTDIEYQIKKETGEDVYIQTAFPLTSKEYPEWVFR